MRNQLGAFIGTLAANNIDWAIGVVDYRDENAAADPAARAAILTPLSTSQAAVQGTLNAMTANNGGDLPESGLEALTLANTSAWRYALGTANYSRQMIMVTDVTGPDVNHDDAGGGFAGDGMSPLDAVTVANTIAAAGVKVNVVGDVTAVQNQDIANTTGGLLGSINNFANVLDSIQTAVMPNSVATVAERTKFIQVGPNSGDNVQFTFEDCRAASMGVGGVECFERGGSRGRVDGD